MCHVDSILLLLLSEATPRVTLTFAFWMKLICEIIEASWSREWMCGWSKRRRVKRQEEEAQYNNFSNVGCSLLRFTRPL